MEHEVFVPVPADRLRAALSDPGRVARAVPGLQQEAGAAPLAGRLKVRVGGHTITYRGALRLADRGDGSYTVEGDGTEARGSGSVKLSLTVRLVAAEGGTTLAFTGTATADGRGADLPPDAVATAAARLLNRFAENLSTAAVPGSDETAARPGARSEPDPAPRSDPEPGPAPRSDPEPGPEPRPGPEPGPTRAEASAGAEPPRSAEPPSPSVFDAEVPPPSPADPAAEAGAGGVEEDLASGGGEYAGGAEEPPAEAAHARRTMIGRSAEEVDHAPPRGRYAPVPAPESTVASPALRWAVPAAALALASAVVVTRALRKRR